MGPRETRTAEVLQQASWHLRYEWTMLQNTVHLIQTNDDSHHRWAALESFLIHARNILHVFFPGDPRLSDVLAVDYFPNPITWQTVRGKKPKILQDFASRVGAEIAHLSYRRLDHDRPTKWNVELIFRELETLVKRFIEHAPKEHIHQDWYGAPPAVDRPIPSPFVVTTTQPGTLTMVNTPAANTMVKAPE